MKRLLLLGFMFLQTPPQLPERQTVTWPELLGHCEAARESDRRYIDKLLQAVKTKDLEIAGLKLRLKDVKTEAQ